MSHDFGTVLQGLLDNRGLTMKVVARASGRAYSTINGLLLGLTPPSEEILRHVAPVLEMPLADLLVIAGIPVNPPPSPPSPYPKASGINGLISVAGQLTSEQLRQLAGIGREWLEHERGGESEGEISAGDERTDPAKD
jgi:transcriptional regulator with XRE-family HTH domain